MKHNILSKHLKFVFLSFILVSLSYKGISGCSAKFSIEPSPFDTSCYFINQSPANLSHFIWNIEGIDSFVHTSKTNFTYKFPAPGVYRITLTAIDSFATTICNESTSIDVEIEDIKGKNLADFSFTLDNKTLFYKNLSLGDFDQIYVDFGDGNFSSSLDDTSHTYQSAGIYQVALKVWNSNTNYLSEKKQTITILPEQIECASNFEYALSDTSLTQIILSNTSIAGNARYFWHFGDGKTSTEENPIHNYLAAGIYTVNLTIKDTLTQCSNNLSKEINVSAITLPIRANFNYINDIENSTVWFSNQSIGKNIIQYIWDFGTGDISYEQNTSYTFANAGCYNVCLSVFADGQKQNTKCKKIIFGSPNNSPHSISYIPNINNKNFVSFSINQTNPIVSGNWYFGDGNSSNLAAPEHTYLEDGIYFCEYANAYFSDFILVNINKDEDKLYSIFSSEPQIHNLKSNGDDDKDVVFKGALSGDISYIEWDFGDGSTSNTGTIALHTYSNTGDYNVCLKAENTETNQECEYCETITVGNNIDPLLNNTTSSTTYISIYPNPITDVASLSVRLNKESNINIYVLETSGKIIETLYQGKTESIELDWETKNVAAGIYFVILESDTDRIYEKIIVQ